MLKKLLWLIIAGGILWCSPLWALEDNPWNNVLNGYLFASADQPQVSTPAQTKLPQLKLQPSICSGPARASASPLDICSNTNGCFDQASFCLTGGFLQLGTQVLALQDPGKVCPPVVGCPIYPFEIKNVHVFIADCFTGGSCGVGVMPIIYSADFSNPTCPKPGNLICSGPLQSFVVDHLCRKAILPIYETCCVNGPYFAGIKVIFGGCANLSLCLDSGCTPCCNYADFGGGFLEWCTIAPVSVGDFGIWTDGLYSCQNICSKADTLRNHFKTWSVITPVKDTFAFVKDQFATYDPLKLDTIDFLSNPAIKDTSGIKRANDHLTWYKAQGKVVSAKVKYTNQFEDTTTIFIDSVKYLLVPTQKQPHPAPDTLLGHYTAYKIRKPTMIKRNVLIADQFDVAAPELIDSLIPQYFLTPAQKNNELIPNSDTHYVAYEIFPKRSVLLSVTTFDQFSGPRGMQVLRSELLLVPTKKDTFLICTHKPNDCNGDGKIDLVDIVCDVNVVFKGAIKPVPNCRCDANCDGVCNLADIVYKTNYIFKGGPKPIPCGQCCIAP